MSWTILNVSFLVGYTRIVIKCYKSWKFNSRLFSSTISKYSYVVCLIFPTIILAFLLKARVLRHFSNRLLSIDFYACVGVVGRRIRNLCFRWTDTIILVPTPFIKVLSTVWIRIAGHLYIIIVCGMFSSVFRLFHFFDKFHFLVANLLLLLLFV